MLLLLFTVACTPPATDPADLTPMARRVERLLAAHPERSPKLSQLRAPPQGFVAPDTIRVWRRSEGSDSSCSGTVEVMDFDDYVKGVLPHEWYASWDEESLMAGAVVIRSYAAWWVAAGGKYDCADVCDTSYTQNYGDDHDDRTDAAIDATAGEFAIEDGQVVFAEYSAENGDPTEYGVSEPLCTGQEVYGHGRGLCQWGSQRWATEEDRTHDWMIAHYYPGAALVPALAATASDIAPIVMRSDQTLQITVEFANTGTAPWPAQAVLLQTATPSARDSVFEDPETWISPSLAAANSDDTAPGQTGLWEFTLLAPSVQTETTYQEAFALLDDDSDQAFALDDPLVLDITVLPSAGGDTGDDTGDAPHPEPRGRTRDAESASACAATPAGHGLSLLGLLGLLGLAGRRR